MDVLRKERGRNQNPLPPTPPLASNSTEEKLPPQTLATAQTVQSTVTTNGTIAPEPQVEAPTPSDERVSRKNYRFYLCRRPY